METIKRPKKAIEARSPGNRSRIGLRLSMAGSVALLLGMCGVFFPISGMNGYAISVAWYNSGSSPEVPANQELYWRGNIMKFTITDNRVTAREAIYDAGPNHEWAQYPSLSLDGKRVAFLRWGKYLRTSSQPVNNFWIVYYDTCHVSVINIDGTGLRDLCTIAAPFFDQQTDWPAGDWVYYAKSKPGDLPDNRQTPEIWKVNVNDPSKNMRVATYGSGLRRWSISINADRTGSQGGACHPNNNNCWLCFPPPGGNFSAPGCLLAALPGCNMGLSTSGQYVGTYLYAPHGEILLWKVKQGDIFGDEVKTISLSTAESWANAKAGIGGELIRWAVNSDKWVLQQIGWYGHADAVNLRSNQVLVNWVDNQAIVTTNNPDDHGNCTGDLWVNGGPAGAYEDVNGKWIAATGGTNASNLPKTTALAPANIQVRTSPGILRVAGPVGQSYELHVFDITGRPALSRRAGQDGIVTITQGLPATGLYIVKVRGANGVEAVKAVWK